jgi:hypothetical protein
MLQLVFRTIRTTTGTTTVQTNYLGASPLLVSSSRATQ